jgi:glucosamine--fructose-6-phosphate aminotransferase (isomerizing)
MCGIVAVVRRRATRALPDLAVLERRLGDATAVIRSATAGAAVDAALLERAAAALRACDDDLRGVPGVEALLGDRLALARLESAGASLGHAVSELDAAADAALGRDGDDAVEARNALLVEIHDRAWAIARDRLGGARRVERLAGSATTRSAIEAYSSISLALAALDRLEVRGRDSAGLHVLVQDHGLDLADPVIAGMLEARATNRLFTAMAVRVAGGALTFAYKVAAEVGELGDNTAELRSQIERDELLRLAVGHPDARTVVLGHTRWASVGIISEPNAHPLNHEEDGGPGGPYVAAALNGDVDNYADLAALEQLRIPAEITTDAKVIPTLVSRRLARGDDLVDAFRATVASFEGSVAIAAQAADVPDRLLLALRGSGQALYVGLAQDAFVVASEPYGLVEEATTYLRLDGETPVQAGNPASAGQIVVLDAVRAGAVEGIERCAYDGTPLPVHPDELRVPEITTRDVDRGEHPHYLLKELHEAPESFRKTLRGRLVERDGRLAVHLAPSALPPAVVDRLSAGAITRVVAVGQGTAAVAAQSLAAALAREVEGTGLRVEATAATELSGFGIRDDMSDTLVVAISQSGTTTDTNRTVDVVRARHGVVISIVNRRQSDLVDKSDGVLYTSDGRDVEMSVASTKAFYAQIAAGLLLAVALADAVRGGAPAPDREALLDGLRRLPAAMRTVLSRRDRIAEAARRHAPSRRSWAVVGNGLNRVAAQELRIKLSELCYKSISCDITEDKKHIDLSAEPLVVVCAAGLGGSNADDVAKEVAIYRAHKGAPIVITSDGDDRFHGAIEVIGVPHVHEHLDFVLAAMAGHLFGYEAALAIDATARPLREARAAIEATVSAHRDDADLWAPLARALAVPAQAFFDGVRSGVYDGSLDAATAVRIVSLLRYATGIAPLETYQIEFGKVGTPATLVDDLTAALTAGIEELTRPVDAIRHQAKTVTVGISRSDETLLRVRLVQAVLDTGVARDNLSYRALRTLVALDEAVDAVLGYTRYRIEGTIGEGATLHVVEKGGVAVGIRSRTEDDPRLRGTKHRAATEREVTVVRGRVDGRTLIAVPEVKGNQTTGIALLHVRFVDRLPPDRARHVLSAYRGRYEAIQDAVTETEPVMRDDVLGEIDLVDLLTEPVFVLAERWRTPAPD